MKRSRLLMIPAGRRLLRHLVLVLLAIFCSVGPAARAADLYQPPLYQPPKDVSLYKLSELKLEKFHSGEEALAFRYQRTRTGTASGVVRLAGSSASGPLFTGSAPIIEHESGRIVLDRFNGGIRHNVHIDLYLVQTYRIDSTKTVTVRVSNPVSFGFGGSHTPVLPFAQATLSPKDNMKNLRRHIAKANQGLPPPPVSPFDKIPKASGDLSKYRPPFTDRFKKQPPALPWPTDSPPPGAKRRKRYPVTIAVPAGWRVVPSDLKITGRIPLQACYAHRWNPITALEENSDGTLNVRWDDYGPAFDCSMMRQQLIIQDSTFRELGGVTSE